MIKDLHTQLIEKKITVRELVDKSLKTIKEKDSDIHALLGLYTDEFLNSQIDAAQKMIDSGTATEMTGIPVVIKDNICVSGQVASAGSKMLDGYVSPYDAHVISELKRSGAVLIGRSNMDEFAMGSSTENSAYGATKNPLDMTRVPGGSSGGSAAVVAYDGVPVSLGTDTGGSIRQPASFCGLVGLKPTYGSVSRYGAMAMGSSLDQIGPFGKTVEDVEILYKTIATSDTRDATSLLDTERNTKKTLYSAPLKKKIGVPKKFIEQEGVDAEVKKNFYDTLENLKNKGFEIVDIDLPMVEMSLAAYYIIMPAEVSSNMGRYDGVRYGMRVEGESMNEGLTKSRSMGLGDEVQRRILLGTYVLSSGYYDAYYNKACALREILKIEFKKVFEIVDVIATPTSPIAPWKFGEKSDPLAMYLADIFTVPANIVGVPAISVPSGLDSKNLPIGFQMMGSWGSEENLFTIAKMI